MFRRPPSPGRFGARCAMAATSVAAVFVAAAAAAVPAQAAEGGEIRALNSPDRVEGSYIVVLEGNPSVGDRAKQLADKHDGKVGRTFTHALDGFEFKGSEKAARALANNPNVAYVEANQRVEALGTQDNPPSWGLDRIDQAQLPLDDSYTYPDTSAGVTAYIIDTGIRVSHEDFGGRATWGYNATGDGRNTDCNGHGTHVAGTTAGDDFGVAKQADLVAVKVLNCQGSGTNAGVIDGVDWVTNNASGPSVANMSLGGGNSPALDDAVQRSIASGITYAVAAGNSDADACSGSPNRVPEAITVGATTINDSRSYFSNWGSCLDIFAPGSDITSAWIGSDSDTNTISGTSMASPHVAGAAALVVGANPSWSPQQVRDHLVNNATTGVISDPQGSPNRLLRVGEGGGGDPDPEPEPGACTDYANTRNGSLNSGDVDVQPDGSYYYSGSSGTHSACLDGPDGTDFDLYLQKWNGWGWSDVDRSISSGPDEQISYSGSAGYYRYQVHAYSGSGSYTLGYDTP